MDYQNFIKWINLYLNFHFQKNIMNKIFLFHPIIFLLLNLVESWPNWPGKWLNIFGASGSGKTHLAKILEKKLIK